MNKIKTILASLLLSSVFTFADEQNPASGWGSSAPAEPEWPRARFFLHAGLADVGLGAKIRFSSENAIYMTIDLRYQVWQFQYIRIPALFYLGGNNLHFVAGFTLLNAVSSSDASGEVGVGLNCDFGKHFGIDALAFTPMGSSSTGASLLLDFRYAF